MPRALAVAAAIALMGPAAAQPAFEQPKTFLPDAETLKQIEAKMAELRRDVAGLPETTPDDIRADVEVYLKATAGVYFFILFINQGKRQGMVPVPEDPTNCCFAGPGSEMLYVTVGKSLCRVELTVAGR